MARAEETTDNEGWIEWAGGECPVDSETRVKVRDRDGYEWPDSWLVDDENEMNPARRQFWDHDRESRIACLDITAYRVVTS